MRAAPPADEEAEAFLIKPKQSKSSNIKGILAVAAIAFALGLTVPSMRQALVGLITGDQWSVTVEGGLGNNREFPLHSVDPNYVSFVVDPASLMIDPPGVYESYPYPVDFTSPLIKTFAKALAPALFVITGGNSNCISYDSSFDPHADALLLGGRSPLSPHGHLGPQRERARSRWLLRVRPLQQRRVGGLHPASRELRRTARARRAGEEFY